jgi:nucleotide-binding universal stress UspA family protein
MILSLTGATILVGVDFSEHCERAVLRTVAIAERNHAQVELVHVFEWTGVVPPKEDSQAEGSNVTQSFWDALVQQAQSNRSRLGEICSALAGDRVSAKIRVVIGEPAGALLLAAAQAHARVGARKRHALPLKSPLDRVSLLALWCSSVVKNGSCLMLFLSKSDRHLCVDKRAQTSACLDLDN